MTGAVSRTALGAGGEFDLIRAFLGPETAPAAGVRVGPGDDALVLEDGTVVCTDLTVEGVHFRRSWLSFREVGYRATAVALSDLAAMAAEPVGALVSLALDPDEAESVGLAVHEGIHEALDVVGGALLGGDLSASPGPLLADVVAVGRAEAPVLRSGARPGDELWVTGRLGGAAAAVERWQAGEEPRPALRSAFARPRPRIREARWLARHAEVHALIDLSDGLGGDAGHLAAAGGVRLVLEPAEIPTHPAAGGAGDEAGARRRALGGGEDYELLLAAAPGAVEPLASDFGLRFDAPLTRVGVVEAGEGVVLRGPGGERPLEAEERGYSHFGAAEPPRPRDRTGGPGAPGGETP